MEIQKNQQNQCRNFHGPNLGFTIANGGVGWVLGMQKIKHVYCPFLRSLDWDGKRNR
jgi:hypothetical protein